MSSVRVLYDFNAEDANELSVFTGEQLTVTNPNMFDGWIQVRNSSGRQGIVPSSYVEYLNNQDDDDIPPPPPSYGYPSTTSAWNLPTPSATYQNNEFDNSVFTNNFTSTTNNAASGASSSTYMNSPLAATNTSLFNNNTTNFDELDDFFGGGTSNTPSKSTTTVDESPKTTTTTTTSNNQTNPASGARSNPPMAIRPAIHDDDDSDGFSEEESPAHNTSMNRNNSSTFSSAANMSTVGTIGKSKSKNNFGLDVFLLRGAIKMVPDSDKFSTIVLNEQRLSVWKRQSPPYQVSIIGYHSDKKYHGVKKFTSYEIQAKIFPQKVSRRYNHFDWLHERLIEKYPNLCIPPLPGKAVTGNFEDDFIAKRKAQLELWLNRMSHHPVIGQSEVFIHFLQSEENSQKWKAGKRKAEKDEYRGAQWFCTLTVPGESVDTAAGIRERVDKFYKSAQSLDNCVKNVMVAMDKIGQLNVTTYKKEYNNLGKKLEEFGAALSNDSLDAPNNNLLSSALVTTGNVYNQIGNIYGEQVKQDINPLLDRLILYRGMIQQMPDIVQFEKSSLQTYEEFQQRPEKLEGRSLMEVTPRRELISHVTFAEINLFNREKVDDFNQYFKSFLQQQIAFYTEITDCLKRAYANFEKIPSSNTSSPSVNYGSSTRK